MKNANREMIVEAITACGEDAPSQTVAKWLMKKRPGAWPSLNAARHSVRWYRGEAANNRGNMAASQIAKRSQKKRIEARENKFRLPKSDSKPYVDFVVPPGCDSLLIMADIHIPYHDERAIETVITRMKRQKFGALMLLGDVMDWYQSSRFCRDPRQRDAKGELETYWAFLDYLRQYHDGPIYFKLGNHDERYGIRIMQTAPELYDIPALSYESVLDIQRHGVELIKDRRRARIGKLYLLHGHEFGGSSYNPVNVARSILLKGYHSALAGHGHQSCSHVESILSGKPITCYGVGCLCDLHPYYRPLNSKSGHGYAVVTRSGEKVRVENILIWDGQEM